MRSCRPRGDSHERESLRGFYSSRVRGMCRISLRGSCLSSKKIPPRFRERDDQHSRRKEGRQSFWSLHYSQALSGIESPWQKSVNGSARGSRGGPITAWRTFTQRQRIIATTGCDHIGSTVQVCCRFGLLECREVRRSPRKYDRFCQSPPKRPGHERWLSISTRARKADGERALQRRYWHRNVDGWTAARLACPTLSPMMVRLTHEATFSEAVAADEITERRPPLCCSADALTR